MTDDDPGSGQRSMAAVERALSDWADRGLDFTGPAKGGTLGQAVLDAITASIRRRAALRRQDPGQDYRPRSRPAPGSPDRLVGDSQVTPHEVQLAGGLPFAMEDEDVEAAMKVVNEHVISLVNGTNQATHV